MDKLTAMQTFAAVARAGSFSGAARALGLPRTRVSQRVQDLEAALSTRLLHRTTRVVSLTEEGRAYLERVEEILGQVAAAEAALTEGQGAAVGRLKVSCISVVARGLILPRLGEFLALHPRLGLALSVSDRLVNLADEGFDCAIRGGEMASSSLISRPLGQVGFGLYAAGAWRAARVEDLPGLPLIKVTGARDGAVRPWPLVSGALQHLEASPPRIETDDDHAALVAAVGGAGVALLPDFSAAPFVAAGVLQRILPQWQASPRPICAVWPSRRYPSARLRAFLDWVTAMNWQGFAGQLEDVQRDGTLLKIE